MEYKKATVTNCRFTTKNENISLLAYSKQHDSFPDGKNCKDYIFFPLCMFSHHVVGLCTKKKNNNFLHKVTGDS